MLPENSNQLLIRLQLAAYGYQPIPNHGKIPTLHNFLAKDYAARELTSRRIKSWRGRKPRGISTGVRVIGGLCVLDNDVDNEIIDGLREWLFEQVPALEKAPMRYGGGDWKWSLFFRSDAPADRHGKPMRSAKFMIDGKPQGLEVFISVPGELTCKRQVGVYGPHTIEKDGTVTREYAWAPEAKALHQVTLADLPVVPLKVLWDALARFEELAKAAGYERAEPAGRETSDALVREEIDPDTAQFELESGAVVTYAMLQDGDRCSSSFHDGDGSNRSKCQVGAVHIRGGQLGVWDHEECCWFVPRVFDIGKLQDAMAAAAPELTNHESIFQRPGFAWDRFYYLTTENKVICTPTGDLWPRVSYISTYGKDATFRLIAERPVQQITWAPGFGELIHDKKFSESGLVAEDGTRVFNRYEPPLVIDDDRPVTPWLDMLRMLYPEDWQHIQLWMAHRAQRPEEKLNHALVLGGAPGIGKDTLLEPLRVAVGPQNFRESGPAALLGQFNRYMQAVVLRISEARDLGEFSRYTFYNHMKAITAAPPDTVEINGKYQQPYYIPNVVGVVITLNEQDSLFLPEDDRRHFVAWSQRQMSDCTAATKRLWKWYAKENGKLAVAAYLRRLDISGFDPKALPPLTTAFHEIVGISKNPDESLLGHLIDQIGRPAALTIRELVVHADATSRLDDTYRLMTSPQYARKLGMMLTRCGYRLVRNPDSADGKWTTQDDKRKTNIYVADRITGADARVAAARARAAAAPKEGP
jgi:hypothetical protein